MKDADIHPLLDREKQVLARRYEKENRVLGLFHKLLNLAVLLAIYHSGFSGWLAQRLPQQSPALVFIVYAAAFQAVMFLTVFPLRYYSGYLHEHKWKFSNQTPGSWLWDQIKAFLVGLVLMLMIVGALFWIMAVSPQMWWLIAGFGMVLVSVVFATLFPVLIMPIFNKYTPVENPELTAALEKTLSRGGLKSSGFFQEDMSRQTKKENAFLAGLGKTRRVVLGDNLMQNMSVPEIESIIAHEVGHYKYRHIWKNILFGAGAQMVTFYLFHLAMKAVFPGFLVSTRENLTLFPYFVIFLGGIATLLFGPMSNAVSRRFEKQADGYALESIADKKAFGLALAGLADRNLANAYPQWWIKILYYSHPPIGERLAMADA